MNQPNPAQERLAPGTSLEQLRKGEWHHPSWGDGFCAYCEGRKAEGHRADCTTALAIISLHLIAMPPDLVSV